MCYNFEKEDHQKPKSVEIKDLNKNQLILLALLLSFVTSIATGIVTVALLQEASPAVGQTINRVVQRTIEKVVPEYISGKDTVQTVVVKEDELVIDAVKKVRAGFVSLFASKDSTDAIGAATSIGNGQLLYYGPNMKVGDEYILGSATSTDSAKVIAVSDFGIALLKTSAKNLASINLGKDSNINSGGSAIILSDTNVSKYIIQGLVSKEVKDEEGKVLYSYHTITLDKDVPLSLKGATVVDLDGNIIGFVIGKGEGTQVLSVDTVSKFVAGVPKN